MELDIKLKKSNYYFLIKIFILSFIFSTIVMTISYFLILNAVREKRHQRISFNLTAMAKMLANIDKKERIDFFDQLSKDKIISSFLQVNEFSDYASLISFLDNKEIAYKKYINNENIDLLILKNSSVFSSWKGFIVPLNKNQYIFFQISLPAKRFLTFIFISTFSSISTSILLALFFLYKNLKKFSNKSTDLLNRLKGGDLKARYTIDSNDPMSELMSIFNEMAREIEGLVNKVKSDESTRISTLQELTHDLRTPIASLKNLLETFKYRKEHLSINEKQELLNLSIIEVNYFERLIEDLLFLGRTYEPKYQRIEDKVIINKLIENEVSVLKRFDTKTLLSLEDSEPIKIRCNEYMLRRMLRNLLENSIKHASNHVNIKLLSIKDTLNIIIKDDGPGFSTEVLKNFGKKRFSRVTDFDNNEKYLSIGLGSVIAVSIANFHDGKILVTNNEAGAQIEIILPKGM